MDLSAIEEVGRTIATDVESGDHVLLRSTVGLGVSRKMWEKHFAAGANGVTLSFCPERTVEGRALEELASLPQIVGAADEPSRATAIRFFEQLDVQALDAGCLEQAELAKLICNTERDVRFGLANEMAMLCDAWRLSFNQVREAVNRDYPRSDLKAPGPTAGPCLAKDGHILVESGMEKGFHARITEAARLQNEHLVGHFVGRLELAIERELLPAEGPSKVALLGLAFKGRPPTDDTRGSLALSIIDQVHKRFPQARIYGYEPELKGDDIEGLEQVILVQSLEEAAQGADVVCVHTDHPEFGAGAWDRLAARVKCGGEVYDFWGVVDGPAAGHAHGVRYVRFGG